MNKLGRHKISIITVLLIYLFLNMGRAQEIVLCVAPDGQLALELKSHGIPCVPDPSHGDRCSGESTRPNHSCDVHTSHSQDCMDVEIFQQIPRYRDPRTHDRARPDSATAAVHHPVPDLSSDSQPPPILPDPDRIPTSGEHIQTVILIV